MLDSYRNKACVHVVTNIEKMDDSDMIKRELGYGYRGKCTKCNKPIRAKRLAEYVNL